jgi:hypothetical protein
MRCLVGSSALISRQTMQSPSSSNIVTIKGLRRVFHGTWITIWDIWIEDCPDRSYRHGRHLDTGVRGVLSTFCMMRDVLCPAWTSTLVYHAILRPLSPSIKHQKRLGSSSRVSPFFSSSVMTVYSASKLPRCLHLLVKQVNPCPATIKETVDPSRSATAARLSGRSCLFL